MKHIIGHKNPDTDTICSALVYQDFLTQKGISAKAFALGPLNKETKFVFEKFGVPEPEQITELPKGTEIILLDHNEEGQSIDNIKDLDIVEIIDHHKVKIETDKPISIYIEPLGSSCSIIAKKYLGLGDLSDVKLSKINASLLIAGIISDTLFFRSPTTTQTDKDLVEKLNEIAEIEDLEKFSLEMFNAKSDLGDMPIEEIIKLDYKIFEFAGNKYGIGVMETTNKDYGLNRKDEITEKLKEIKTKDGLKAVFFSIVDILNEASYTLTSGNEEAELFTKIFGAVEKEGSLFVDKLVSTKKQIVPRFQENLMQN
ncbi:MAG: manganese-dependent inorganic pyrophosphatase [Candidatus Pacebacteria bacterium]|nr:manganese-dependent inorganic pyrophosphatase [Candidatus Paceibacterota bacterium]